MFCVNLCLCLNTLGASAALLTLSFLCFPLAVAFLQKYLCIRGAGTFAQPLHVYLSLFNHLHMGLSANGLDDE